ncbi:hypothetical protein AGABI1DRAFT_132809 [Agaricus bisporus var. burnettii JB137-S8]|uniref:SAC3/GANP/THP3 conserved domain-containing protein n=1 Tax=Agaricus bisporus var. burnettii (strain JB137-S8 / ATCC MYA-4627 / FGSC 10392) TaxID=597362 RepID=K5XK00_AGABU|nr:uncharacterized protein AGABI1DRAFT_132809 [Agaricus bisporus var. burnettii JB137-S8]EKM74835.1 hypothetical protein AGABI1DRAFT_132809 [Agaricus bisporus var. burnettii JB137-S8]
MNNHTDGERWERGGGRGGQRGRGRGRGARTFPNQTLRNTATTAPKDVMPTQEYDAPAEMEEEMDYVQDDANEDLYASDFEFPEINEPEFETQEERERFYQELVKARDVERKKAIAEGKMDDPLVPKRLEDAITMVGTCMDMCPRFERYRRERENNLFEWETIPGTKRINHKRAVKMYERAAGDKTLPSDLRPPKVLKKTLDYLFHDLLPRGGFSQTYTFIRDRSRAVRNDLTLQHELGSIAIECHDRCARFHILALHLERDKSGFSVALEEQQLMNTLQSLKEFYEEQRGHYESPTELEMRVYHRLIHIRDQKERHEEIPEYITSHPVFKLTTQFRLHVQNKSAPITKTSALVVDAEGMQIFGQLAGVLREQGSVVMIYLVACILERLFGKDTIEDIEAIRGDLGLPEIIDGKVVYPGDVFDNSMEMYDEGEENRFEEVDELDNFIEHEEQPQPFSLQPGTNASGLPPGQSPFFGQALQPSVATSAFGDLAALSTGTTNIFGGGTFGAPNPSKPTSVFGDAFSSARKPSEPVADVKLPQPMFGSLGKAAPFNGSAPPTLPSSRKSLVDAPPLQDNVPAGPSVSQPSFFGNASSFAPSPFQPQVGDTTNSKPTPSSFFGAPTLPQSRPQSESVGKSASPLSAPPSTQPSLNTSAPSFIPNFFNNTSRPPSTAATPPPAATVNGAPLPHEAVTPPRAGSSQSAFSMHTAPKLKPRKSSTPPLRIDTTVSPPAPAVPPVPMPIPPASKPKPLIAESTINLGSPTIPPPLKKHGPISLPSTPASAAPHPILGFLQSGATTPITPQGSSNLSVGGSASASGSMSNLAALSPLDMPSTPSTSYMGPMKNFSSPRRGVNNQGSLLPALLRKDKGKAPEVSTPKFVSPKQNGLGAGEKEEGAEAEAVPTREELYAKARAFRDKTTMKKSWSKWKKRIEDIVTWVQAVEHSDAYRAKLKSKKALQTLKEFRLSARSGTVEKRRRITSGEGTSGSLGGSPIRKRQRKKRISDVFHERRTDEEIAKRLKEKREENQELWAQSSYLNLIRTYVQAKMKTRKSWSVWLSLNPESDSSAIWLERKFDVPNSGRWASESIFEIPLFPDLNASQDSEKAKSNGKGKEKSKMKEDLSTGLIVFECTPTDHIQDELEKKYCVLDDCSRLRDIIDSLSSKRHYIPSLLVLNWGTGDQSNAEPAAELVNLIRKYVGESVLAGYATLEITATTNLDSVLNETLQKLKLDLEGKLVRFTTVQGIFRTFEEEFSNFLIEWLDNCSSSGHFDWRLYGHLVQATIGLLNKMGSLVTAMLTRSKRDLLENFDIDTISDSQTTYESALAWLSRVNHDGDTEKIAIDLQSHFNIGQEFPARTFIQHLLELTVLRTEKHTNIKPQERQHIPLVDLKAASELFETTIQKFWMNLNLALNMSVRRSPKRRETSEETDASPEAKRRRTSLTSVSTLADASVPNTPYINGRQHSPSLSLMSNTSIVTETPGPGSNSRSVSESPSQQITVAMLRQLTRDMKKKYGSTNKSSKTNSYTM